MGSHTTRADAAPPPADPVEHLLALCAREQRLYERVLAFARRQGETIRRAGSISEVRRVLDGKRFCLEEIARIEAEQGELRASAESEAWSPGDRARLHGARARIAALIEEILACEETNDRDLLSQTRLI